MAYSNKGNASEDTYKDLKGSGPQVLIHKDMFLSIGLATGTGTLVRMSNTQSKNLSPSSAVYIQGDVTYFKEGWLGSHEFKTGFYGAPRSRYDVTQLYVNDGFILQEVRQIDPDNPAAGVTPFRMQYITPNSVHTTAARDKDLGVYGQDSWKPNARMTASVGVRVDWIRRYDEIVDINGIYPSAPSQAFGGFGLVDPNRGIIYQQRNNTWSTEVVNALEAVVAKNMSHNFQAMVSVSRQWQHMAGTWNPTDPARFIQPDAFPNNRILPASSGNVDTHSLDGASSAFAGWRPYSFRAVGQYLAPWGVTLAGGYEVSSGDYSAPMFTRLSAADPRFGPSTVTLANGTRQANPLATTIRFAFPTRGEGQVLNEATRALQIKIGREFKLGRNRLTASLNIFNLLNSGANTQYATGANQLYNPLYLSASNRLPARGFQLMFVDRF